MLDCLFKPKQEYDKWNANYKEPHRRESFSTVNLLALTILDQLIL